MVENVLVKRYQQPMRLVFQKDGLHSKDTVVQAPESVYPIFLFGSAIKRSENNAMRLIEVSVNSVDTSRVSIGKLMRDSSMTLKETGSPAILYGYRAVTWSATGLLPDFYAIYRNNQGKLHFLGRIEGTRDAAFYDTDTTTQADRYVIFAVKDDRKSPALHIKKAFFPLEQPKNSPPLIILQPYDRLKLLTAFEPTRLVSKFRWDDSLVVLKTLDVSNLSNYGLYKNEGGVWTPFFEFQINEWSYRQDLHLVNVKHESDFSFLELSTRRNNAHRVVVIHRQRNAIVFYHDFDPTKWGNGPAGYSFLKEANKIEVASFLDSEIQKTPEGESFVFNYVESYRWDGNSFVYNGSRLEKSFY